MAHILIIDDDPIIRAYLRAVLEGEDGHRLQEAQNGDEGIQLYRKHPFDLVITDILMPVKDGVELILEMTESFSNVRIIAMSGGGRGLDATFNLDMAKDFGAMRVLTKPFSAEDLRSAVADLLAH
ncbi:MAG: response regulator [Magnetococcales bacterium]|nr:response regulator [Magnetococcales bacterium]MBF0151833.1 response regulator [Magnetococcales bacterium]MBF0173364.1 response regulator [Magnetococcales bacterium]MBF0346951.1 response regulator [Magnetococcales bacterium]MBF0632776.1 response regulator [Magnetococcales bacterium]